MTNNPTDLDPRLALLEALVKDKVRAAASAEERAKLMELLPFLASVRDLPRLREALKDMQRKLDEATSAPLEYAVFLGLCPPRTGQEEGDEVWQMLNAILSEAISRELNPEARRKIQDLQDFLKDLLVTGRDVIVGHHGQRMEVRLAYSDVLPEELYEGQQLVLNKHRNVVGLRSEFVRGDTAEVANVLSPAGTARVIGLPEDEFGPLRVQWPDGDKFEVRCSPDLLRTLHRGDVVSIDPDGQRAVARVRPRLHVRIGSTETVVEISDALFQEGVEVGDIVRVEPRLGFAFEKLPAHETGSLTLEAVPDVSYEDIGGLDEQIEQIQDAIELPYIYRSLFDLYQLPRPKGILLFGPPGCGKTLIAKAVANNLTRGIREHLTRLADLIQIYTRLRDGDESAAADYRAWKARAPGRLAAQNGHEAAALDAIIADLRLNDVEPDEAQGKLRSIQEVLRRQDGIRSYFLNVKGPELLTKWVGETEHRIRKIFEEAKRQASFYTPVVIFFDEMEAMFRTRGSGRSSDVETTIVPQFLSEMDGVEVSENVIIIGASNRADLIDPAIMRPGRLDIKIRIHRPNHEAAMQIMALYLTPDLPLDTNGLKRPPEAYGRNLTFKTQAVKRTAKIVAPEWAEAISAALPPKTDMRRALETSVELRQLCDSDPRIRAAVAEIAAREQVTEAIIVETTNLLFSPTSRLETTLRNQSGGPDERLVFALRDFVSGAMLMSIVSRAKKRALKRRIPPIQSDQAGIDVNDLRAALHDEFNENAEQFVANWMQENIGSPRQGDIRGVKIYLEAVDEDPWGMEKARPYRHERRVSVEG